MVSQSWSPERIKVTIVWSNPGEDDGDAFTKEKAGAARERVWGPGCMCVRLCATWERVMRWWRSLVCVCVRARMCVCYLRLLLLYISVNKLLFAAAY